MSWTYDKVPDAGDGLHLHLNENTAGCSPRVLDALKQIRPHDVAFYPDYSAVVRDAAASLGVTPDRLILTNGLDEGILLASVTQLRATVTLPAPEALIVEPTFDEYAASADAVGGRVVTVQPRAEFVFPLEETLERISPATRLVFLTDPNNPTGQRVPRSAIQAIAERLPREALLLLDEAYADFAGESLIADLECYPQVVVGRTFAKAHGLAALRIGALVGVPESLSQMRRVVPPYNLNVCAMVALQAALKDPDHVRWYIAQASESKRLLYGMCDHFGFKYWPSAANFVLVRVDRRIGVQGLVDGLARRGIFIRDRSGEPGCQGCVRITAGVVEHTQACIAAIEEMLCDGA